LARSQQGGQMNGTLSPMPFVGKHIPIM
jgi:hypothetical protein